MGREFGRHLKGVFVCVYLIDCSIDIVNDQESIRTNFAMRKTELIEAEKQVRFFVAWWSQRFIVHYQLKDQLAIASAESGRVVANRKAVRSGIDVI